MCCQYLQKPEIKAFTLVSDLCKLILPMLINQLLPLSSSHITKFRLILWPLQAKNQFSNFLVSTYKIPKSRNGFFVYVNSKFSCFLVIWQQNKCRKLIFIISSINSCKYLIRLKFIIFWVLKVLPLNVLS